MSNLTATEKRTAAGHLASVWGDGVRRVVVARRTSFRVGQQTLTYDPTQVIDDAHTIALLEQNDIDYIDLEVNGRPKRGKGLIDAENDVNENIDAIAAAIGISAAVLHDAVENGGVDRIIAVAAAVKAVAARDNPPADDKPPVRDEDVAPSNDELTGKG